MALPTNSVAPDAPNDSTPIDGVLGLGNDDQEIVNFIKALSPSGASAYDTGWVDCTPAASGFTGTCKARRQGKLVEVRFNYSVTPSVASGAYFAVANLPGAVPAPTGDAAFGMARVQGSPTVPVPAYISSGGVLSYINTSGVAKTTLAGSVMYMVG
ncbi:hypothetical protein [Galactobacter valiniphilus]|uniref:hypothetical protein n=1 Tax=Galactobacter valiniphilus TaxID=2676122 RepID=UPI0037360CB8